MNSSARQAARKWPRPGKMVAMVAILGLVCALPPPGQARGPRSFGAESPHRGVLANVPLPRSRPSEAPPRQQTGEAKGEPEAAPVTEAPAKPGEPKPDQQRPAETAPQLSACRQALTEEIAIAPSIPSVHGPGGCGGDDLVRLEAIVLPDKHRVAVTPAATLRCPMASEVARWVRSDIAPLTQKLGSEIAVLDNFDSFECRGRNRVKGAPLSEHGKANALDVRAFKLADGREINLTDRSQPRSLREDVLHSVCARFATVLGPDSDWYHEDHIHLDLAERRNNYRICEWDVLDPLPAVAPLVPAERPAEAPPREVPKDEGAKEEAPVAEGDKLEEAKPAEQAQPASRPRRSAKLKK